MRYQMPAYYNKFKCVADKCPDTCCVGWEIVIDEKTMDKYRNLAGDTGEYVRNGVDMVECVYKRQGTGCHFLNDNMLCDLYINAGEDKLCKTCARYPRHFEEYGNLIEAALSMSCPIAARLIIHNENTDTFKIRQDDKKVKTDVDDELLEVLLKIRKVIFKITSNRKISIDKRMKLILSLGERLQPLIYDYERLGMKRRIRSCRDKLFSQIDKKLYEYELALSELEQEHSDKGLTVLLNEEAEFMEDKAYGGVSKLRDNFSHRLIKSYIDMFLGLENINDEWPEKMEEVIDILYERNSEEEYDKLKQEFISYMKERAYEYEHILNYFIYTYFLGGVYDYNIQGMIKLAVVSTIIIRETGLAAWLKNNRTFTVNHQIDVAYTYSRQVEHSENNLLSFEGILTAHPLFSEEKIRLTLPE